MNDANYLHRVDCGNGYGVSVLNLDHMGPFFEVAIYSVERDCLVYDALGREDDGVHGGLDFAGVAEFIAMVRTLQPIDGHLPNDTHLALRNRSVLLEA